MNIAHRVVFFLAETVLKLAFGIMEDVYENVEYTQKAIAILERLPLDESHRKRLLYWIDKHLAEISLLENRLEDYRKFLEESRRSLL